MTPLVATVLSPAVKAALAAGAGVCLLTVLLGIIGLPMLRRLHVGQNVRDDGPKTHLKKSGTPTFGGMFFLLPMMAAGAVLASRVPSMRVAGLIVIFMTAFGVVGFIDDYTKVRISKEGMTVRQKTVALGLLSLAAAICFVFFVPECVIYLPFTVRKVAITGGWRILYAAFLVPFFFYMSNSVNITDGLDGLLAGLMAIASLFLFVTSLLLMRIGERSLSVTAMSIVMMGGCLGFLVFNRHPAKVFMGDLGSQALGIGFVLLTVVMGMPYLSLVTGFIFFFEGLSVTLQFLYYRHTGGKRIFKMAPIHHHFELSGWKETQIVRRFYLVGWLCGLIGLAFVAGLFR